MKLDITLTQLIFLCSFVMYWNSKKTVAIKNDTIALC